MPEMQTLTKTRITGEISAVRYEDPKDGFVIISVNCADGSKITACGIIPTGAAAGQNIEADGYFEKHPSYGLQFRMESCRPVPPSTTEGIERFLRHSVHSIGPKTAKAIVKAFGKETLQILDLYPRRLLEIPKIGKRKAETIIKNWKNSRTSREDLIFLQGLGLTPAFCAKLMKHYGDKTVAAVRSNPYRLAEDINGIGFLKADAVAANLGFAKDSPARLAAAAVFTLNTMLSEGHSCAPQEEFIRRVSDLAKQPDEAVKQGIEMAIQRHLLYLDRQHFYTPLPLLAETRLPRLLAALAAATKFHGRKLAKIAPKNGLSLDKLQQHAVEAVFSSPLSIITGGPGVGKTTVIGEIVRRAKAAKVKISLAAPTGRAAKRMSSAAGMEAKTLHRLLIFDPATNKFVHNADNPLGCELLIVDEVSMLDIILAWQLFQAIPENCSVVLVGDADQLPSVGPGRVLHDFMASGFFQVTKLTKVFRQAENSNIITNAHLVNNGKLPMKLQSATGELADFYWLEQDDPEHVTATVEKLITERIPLRFGFDPMNDIQVLSPMNRGNCGTAALNELLSSKLNADAPVSFQFGERIFKQGDRVMQTSNNYDKNVFNGDLGRIVQMDREKRTFIVEFENERPVEYAFEDADQLTLAYAITIHKSQGSEFPVVILPLLTQHFVMLQRNLLYTGMTRAKKLLLLIASKKTVEIAVKNFRLRPRFSLLGERLRAEKEQLNLPNR